MTDERRDGWQPIAVPPPDKTVALLFYGELSWPGMGPLRTQVERLQIGWYSDGDWYEGGTGHEVFEDWRSPEQLPTHWMASPNPPEVVQDEG